MRSAYAFPLGAQRDQVLWLMLVDRLRPACLGLVLGLIGGGLTAKVIRGLLYGVRPLDASAFAAVAVLLLLVASVACAVQASRLNPMQATGRLKRGRAQTCARIVLNDAPSPSRGGRR